MAVLSFDPLTLPIVAVSDDRALRADEIDAAAVRLAFSKSRSWTPETIVEPTLRAKASEPTPAAVLIGLVQRDEGLSVLLTQRTAHLHDHPHLKKNEPARSGSDANP